MWKDRLEALFERAKNLILKPSETWDQIAAEETTVPDLYKRWIMPLAAIPAVASFIGAVIVGVSVLGLSCRVPFANGLSYAVVSYALSLAAVYVYARILDILAPHFGAEKNMSRAFRVAAYFPAAFWIAGVFALIPPLAVLSILGLYSLYLLYVGLPKLMPPAEGKSGGFVLAAIAAAVILYAIVAAIASPLLGADGCARERIRDRTVALEPAAPAAPAAPGVETRADAIGRAVESGEIDQVLAALFGAGSAGATVDPEALRGVAPSRLAGLTQRSVNVQQAETPIKLVTLSAEYADDNRSVSLRIVNSPVMRAMWSAFGFAGATDEQKSDGGYEKLRRERDGWVIEEWDRRTETGRYGATRGDTFIVEASGRGVSMRDLERAVDRFSARELESLPVQEG